MADWLELRVECQAAAAEAVADWMIDQGTQGVVFGDYQDLRDDTVAGREPSQEVGAVTAYFDAGQRQVLEQGLGGLQSRLHQRLGKPAISSWHFELHQDPSWWDGWKDYYHPFSIDTFYIQPAWESGPTPAGQLLLKLEPGLAFGTGTHASTQLCLQLLSSQAGWVRGKRVLDVGCGSGILSLAAARLAAREVRAVDIDGAAVRSTRDNAARNGLQDRIEAQVGDLADLTASGQLQRGGFELVMANLTAGLLHRLAPHLTTVLASGGQLLLSGIIVEREQAVRAAFRQFAVREHQQQDGWTALLLEGG